MSMISAFWRKMRPHTNFHAIWGLLVLPLGVLSPFVSDPRLTATESQDDRRLSIAELGAACVEWYDRYVPEEPWGSPSSEQAPPTGGTQHSHYNSLAHVSSEVDGNKPQQLTASQDASYRPEFHSQPVFPLSNAIGRQSEPQTLTGGDGLPEPSFDHRTARVGNPANPIVIDEVSSTKSTLGQTRNWPKPLAGSHDRPDNEDVDPKQKFARLSDFLTNNAAESGVTRQRSDVPLFGNHRNLNQPAQHNSASASMGSTLVGLASTTKVHHTQRRLGKEQVRDGREQWTSANADKDASNWMEEVSSSSQKDFMWLDLRSGPAQSKRLSARECLSDCAFIFHVQTLYNALHTSRVKKETHLALQQARGSPLVQEELRRPISTLQSITHSSPESNHLSGQNMNPSSEMADVTGLADKESRPSDLEISTGLKVLIHQLWHMNQWFLYLFGISASDDRFVTGQNDLFKWFLQCLNEPKNSSPDIQGSKPQGFNALQWFLINYLSKPNLVTLSTKIDIHQAQRSIPRQSALGTQVAMHILGCHYKTKNKDKWIEAFKEDYGFWQLFKHMFEHILEDSLDTFLNENFSELKNIPAVPW